MVESTFEPNITVESVGQAIRAHLRVLKLTRKPSREEFLTIAKVAGIGILAVGTIGFIVYVLLTMLPQWVAQ
ncbi:MAG: protein translocase SEC61 complex subunit gamma [Methanosarcina thermophila]|jgi:protein transport protein SEC61 subunit gamma-like protein|uniref:Protein translocase subunit SecE n=3 Tax=Methanosarcina thermophila TaxID=2210 RepID=A0A1I6X598_METTE|nr:protein translocase SEC61 complex subunit gamma [Methanosarcina thermophila]ALK04670.1 MAG: preprotein translocase subunit SecE [Methanosarcina sp. 795]AKB13352.1 Preprotein translocase subunit SecE [Methanosarcina thermophila TM-1]AKB16013.1 Preprotein translocase subunit SecE [Methanosarcina thermophila CHTI-55]NLU57977.1 protein translocase SEC61 complex subunit gamma [Methanosarcina thermophila]SFT33443.1 protein translocase subunit secE/sec61 gamma [Methanosarcina thermophila]